MDDVHLGYYCFSREVLLVRCWRFRRIRELFVAYWSKNSGTRLLIDEVFAINSRSFLARFTEDVGCDKTL